MEVIGWPNNVNQRILQETGITEGENGFAEDSTSNGYKQRRATSLTTGKKYAVKMDFDWGGQGSEFQFPVDKNGLTEYDRFIKWYKYVHQKGAKPFWFPSITKDSIDNLHSNEYAGMCLYQITSSLQEQNSGYSMSISMTWEEVYSGIINMPSQEFELKEVIGRNGKANVKFTDIPSTVPLVNDFTVLCSVNDGESKNLKISSVSCSNDTAALSFEAISFSGYADITVTYKEKSGTYRIYS